MNDKEHFLTKAPGRHARRSIQAEAEELLRVARENGVTLGYADMDIEDGMITIDGMHAPDWMRDMIGFEAWEQRS